MLHEFPIKMFLKLKPILKFSWIFLKNRTLLSLLFRTIRMCQCHQQLHQLERRRRDCSSEQGRWWYALSARDDRLPPSADAHPRNSSGPTRLQHDDRATVGRARSAYCLHRWPVVREAIAEQRAEWGTNFTESLNGQSAFYSPEL